MLVVACVAIAGLTLLLPSAPTYDPWAWIIWGREIAHLDLVTTGGPSWKPLPVLFTTVFSLFGSVAPDLWLVVARAGAIAAVALAFRVARRLGGGVVGGVAAAAALAIAPWWIRNAALGNSEGLIVAFLLATIDRHLAGDRRAAFLLAVCAGLLRPEAWPFLGLYGLWLLWRRELPAGSSSASAPRSSRSGCCRSGGARATCCAPPTAPRTSTRARRPTPTTRRVRCSQDAGADAHPAADRGPGARRSRCCRAARPRWAFLAGLAIAWLGLVAYMTSDGFSGNQRYLIAPVALVIVLAGAGRGWGLGRASASRGRAAVAGARAPGAGVLLVAAAPSGWASRSPASSASRRRCAP